MYSSTIPAFQGKKSKKKEKHIQSEARIPITAISEIAACKGFLHLWLEFCFVLLSRCGKMDSEIKHPVHIGTKTNKTPNTKKPEKSKRNHPHHQKDSRKTTTSNNSKNLPPNLCFVWIGFFCLYFELSKIQ